MAPTQLSLYNNAFLAMGAGAIANLSVTEEKRRVMDTIYDSGTVITDCLEQGFWKHAMRSNSIDYNGAGTPPTGWTYQVDKPSDMVKLYSFCSDERFDSPIVEYLDEGAKWYLEDPTVYVRYVSNGASYGTNFALWPERFTRFVEHYMAMRAIKRITDAKVDADDLKADLKKIKLEALTFDALKEPTKYPLPTSWQQSRMGRESYRRRYHPYR